jgi:hypothetical protein
MPCEDPGLNERFLGEVLGFKTAERVVESMDHPEVIGTWMSCGESPHDIAFIKGLNGKLHQDGRPAGERHLLPRPGAQRRLHQRLHLNVLPGTIPADQDDMVTAPTSLDARLT